MDRDEAIGTLEKPFGSQRFIITDRCEVEPVIRTESGRS